MAFKEKFNRVNKWLADHRLKNLTYTFLGLFLFYLIVDNIVMPLAVRLGQSLTVPDITRIALSDAEKTLDQFGLKIVLEGEKYDQSIPPGHVVSQNPKANSKVKKGRRIYVMTSMGERLIQVPDLKGRSERDAKFIIQSSRLTLAHVSYEHSSYYLEGTIAEQSVKAGTEVKIGTSINMVISLGRFPDRFLVPDLKGKDLDVAIKRIRKSGLNLGNITYQIEPDLLPNTVISQSIEPGEEVTTGTAIDLTVSQIPEL